MQGRRRLRISPLQSLRDILPAHLRALVCLRNRQNFTLRVLQPGTHRRKLRNLLRHRQLKLPPCRRPVPHPRRFPTSPSHQRSVQTCSKRSVLGISPIQHLLRKPLLILRHWVHFKNHLPNLREQNRLPLPLLPTNLLLHPPWSTASVRISISPTSLEHLHRLRRPSGIGIGIPWSVPGFPNKQPFRQTHKLSRESVPGLWRIKTLRHLLSSGVLRNPPACLTSRGHHPPILVRFLRRRSLLTTATLHSEVELSL